MRVTTLSERPELSVTRKAIDSAYGQDSPRFFYRLDSALRQHLHAMGDVTSFRRGEILIAKDDQGENLYILLEGQVKAVRKGSERQLCLSLLYPGDCFGELSVIDKRHSSAEVSATEAGRALCISRDRFYETLQHYPVFLEQFLRCLSCKMRDIIDNVCAMALDDVYGRLRRIFYRLATNYNGQLLIENITHLELSEMIGASREMVTIIFKELRQGGYIETSDRSIRILQPLPRQR